MPLTCVIDKQSRLVSSTAWGTLSYPDIAAHQDRRKNDPDFNPGFDRLFDGTRVTRVALTVEEIQTVARQKIFAAGSPQAFATSSEFAYGVARMFEICLEKAHHWVQPPDDRRKA